MTKPTVVIRRAEKLSSFDFSNISQVFPKTYGILLNAAEDLDLNSPRRDRSAFLNLRLALSNFIAEYNGEPELKDDDIFNAIEELRGDILFLEPAINILHTIRKDCNAIVHGKDIKTDLHLTGIRYFKALYDASNIIAKESLK